MKTIDPLLSYELTELLYAKRQMLEALSKLLSSLSDLNMKNRIEQHMIVVERHIESLAEARSSMLMQADQNQNFDMPIHSSDQEYLMTSDKYFEMGAYHAAIMIAEALHDFECAELLKKQLHEELENQEAENSLDFAEQISEQSAPAHFTMNNRMRKDPL